MIREDAYALGNIIHQEVITFYESQLNEIFKKCTICPPYRSFRGNTNIRSKLVNPIYNDHEAQLKAKDEEIERLKEALEVLTVMCELGIKTQDKYSKIIQKMKVLNKARSIVAMLFGDWKKHKQTLKEKKR